MSFLDSIFGGGQPSIPKPTAVPNANKLISQQQAANNKAFNQGLINTSGPFGSTTYKNGTLNTSLSPQVSGVLNPLFSNASTLASGLTPGQWSPEQQKYADSVYNSQVGLLQPGFDRALNSLTTQAAERGLPLGSEAYNGLFAPTLESQNATLGQAANTAALAGEQLPYQNLGSTLGFINQVPQPQAMNPLSAPQAVNTAGIAQNNYGLQNQSQQQYFQNQQNQYNQQQAALGSILGAGAGLGGYLLGSPATSTFGKLVGV